MRCSWSKAQMIAYRSACGITGSISTIGSSLIILMIFRSRTKLTRVQNRLLLPMCIFDILGSIAQALSTIPLDTNRIAVQCPFTEDVVKGNHATCTAQGFFYQLGMAVPGYNAALCIYYAMVIKWKKTDEETKRVEPYLHALVLFPVFIAAAIALSNDLYGNKGILCFLANNIYEDTSDRIHRKKQILINLIGAMFLFVGITIITTIVYSLVAVYSTVKEQEQRMSVYRFERPGASRKKSKLTSTTMDTKIQAYLYVLGFFVTYTFPAISFVSSQRIDHRVSYSVILLQGIFAPLQGFWNFLIFIRPRFNIVTKDHPEKSFWKRLSMTVLAKGGDGRKGNTKRKDTKVKNPKPQLSKSRDRNKGPKSTLLDLEERTNSTDSRLDPSDFYENPPKSCTRDFPNILDHDPIPCIEGSNSYYSDNDTFHHPVPQPVGSSDTIVVSNKYIGNESTENDDDQNYDDQNNNFGPLSNLVAQDIFGSNILSQGGRRRSMIDFRSTALDKNGAENRQSQFFDMDYIEEDGERKSRILDNFTDAKLAMGSGQQELRKSCPSLAFTWKEVDEINIDRKTFGELDDILLGASTLQLDYSDVNQSPIAGPDKNENVINLESVSHDIDFEENDIETGRSSRSVSSDIEILGSTIGP